MILHISQLRHQIAAQFSNVEQLNDSIIRFTRNVGDVPIAVYYLDISQDLPSTQEMLADYQDRIVGTRYFDGRRSTQWNNYLYFITTEARLAHEEVRRVKEMIERDRNYARKFVISGEDFSSILHPPVIMPPDEIPETSVLSVWTDLLAAAGLDTAILSDDNLPARLRLIENTTKPPRRYKEETRNLQVKDALFIRSLRVKKFRDYLFTSRIPQSGGVRRRRSRPQAA